MADWTDFPECPNCGQVDQDWWDGGAPHNAGDGDEWESNCGSCGKDYRVTMAVSCSFSTSVSATQEGGE